MVRGCGLTVLSHMPAIPEAHPPPSDPQAMSEREGRGQGFIKINKENNHLNIIRR